MKSLFINAKTQTQLGGEGKSGRVGMQVKLNIILFK